MNKNTNILYKNTLKRCISFGFFLVITLLFTLSASAQVTVQTDTTKIRIGEQIQLKYLVDKQEGVAFPKLQLDSLQKMEVVKSLPVDTIKDKLVKKYLLTSFDSGRYELPKQLIRLKNKQYYTKPIVFDVSTVQVDTTKQKLFPIKAIQHQELNLKDYAKNYWWLLALIPILGFAVWWFFIRKKPTEEEKIAKIPPFELAVKQLNELDKKLLWQNNKTKEYYSELTDILRVYIEKEFKVPALESTTSELINALKKFKNESGLDISSKTIIKLKDLLKEADLVKFAKSKPFAEEIQMHRRYADEILDGLKVEEEIDEEENKTENLIDKTKIESEKIPISNSQIDNKINNLKQNTLVKKKKSSVDKKKIINTTIGILAFFISYTAIQYFVFNKNNIDKMLIEITNEINKSCPMTLDKETRLDNTIALPNKTLQYNYTLTNMDKSVVNTDDLKNYLEPRILSNIKTNPDMKSLRDNKVTFAYSYVDKNNEFILKIIVPSKMYIKDDQ